MDQEQNKTEKELPVPDPKELEAKLAKAEQERDEYLNGWKRAKADLINYKKEDLQRLEEAVRYVNEEFMQELIAVLDNFDLGIAALEKQGPVEKGVYMIRAQLEDILKRRGLTRINISPGDKFDPNVAEAITAVESESPPDCIVEVIEPGYRLGDKIVRPARVKISKNK